MIGLRGGNAISLRDLRFSSEGGALRRGRKRGRGHPIQSDRALKAGMQQVDGLEGGRLPAARSLARLTINGDLSENLAGRGVKDGSFYTINNRILHWQVQSPAP